MEKDMLRSDKKADQNQEPEDGVQVKPDTVYVIPPDNDMGIHNHKLLLLKKQQTPKRPSKKKAAIT